MSRAEKGGRVCVLVSQGYGSFSHSLPFFSFLFYTIVCHETLHLLILSSLQTLILLDLRGCRPGCPTLEVSCLLGLEFPLFLMTPLHLVIIYRLSLPSCYSKLFVITFHVLAFKSSKSTFEANQMQTEKGLIWGLLWDREYDPWIRWAMKVDSHKWD